MVNSIGVTLNLTCNVCGSALNAEVMDPATSIMNDDLAGRIVVDPCGTCMEEAAEAARGET